MEDESLDFAAMEQLKQLAPHLYTGVKERLLVETVVAAWEQYTEHLRDETPHKVQVDSFWIGKYEVTNAKYRECFLAGISSVTF